MTIREHYQRELGNADRITLLKEGLFWKAYERSAYLVILRGFDFQVHWHTSKECPEGVVSLGFPEVSLEKVAGGLKAVESTETKLVFEADRTVSEGAFQQWKDGCLKQVAVVVAKSAKRRRRIIEDPLMHEALSVKEEDVPMEKKVIPCPETPDTSWKDRLIDRIRDFDQGVHSMVESVVFLSELKKEILEHGRV